MSGKNGERLLSIQPSISMLRNASQIIFDTWGTKTNCGRLAGADMPSFSNTETTIPELKDRIAKTIDFLKGLKPAQIDGSEDKAIKITFPSGATREFTGQSLLLTNSLPNFYFHCTTAYDILRHCGVEIGKRDFMGTPVSL